MRTIAIMNQKGGTAKTVSCINAAAILEKYYGQRVLLADADSQGNLTEFVSKDPEGYKGVGGTADLLQGKPVWMTVTKIPNAMLLAGDEMLMTLDISSAQAGIARPMALADWLASEEIADRFDTCLIDCPPAFNAAAIAALAAADEVIIPVKLDAFGIRGLAKIMAQIRNMKKVNPDLEVTGVLPTMYYKNEEQRRAEEELRSSLLAIGIRLFHHIRRSPKVDSSTFEQTPLIYFSPTSAACRDYRYFVRELMGEEAEDDGV